MISYLRLENFRRHAETELFMGEADQVILLAGANGAGKTSITEAMLFALYGQSRKGAKGLASMVRRGAELEGMQVELDFKMAGQTYKVQRRLEVPAGRTVSSAVLYCDGIALVETSTGVTEEVTRLLGMDARGFKLATFAAQKELDGLASLPTNDRRKMVSRLLRVDVIERARDKAGAMKREQKHLVKHLTTDNSTVLGERVKELSAARDTAAEIFRAAKAIEEKLEAELEASAWVDESLRSAHAAHDRATKELDDATGEVDHVTEQIAGVEMPEAVEGGSRSVEQLAAEKEVLAGRIKSAEAAAVRKSQARQFEADLVKWNAELADARKASGNMAALIEDQSRTSAAAAKITAQIEEAEGELSELRSALAESRTLHKRATSDLNAVQCLEAECVTCGQEISEDHRASQVTDASTEVDTLASALADITASGIARGEDLEKLKAALTAANVMVGESGSAISAAQSAAQAAGSLEDRIKGAQTALDAISPTETEDVVALEDALAQIEADLTEARSVAETNQARSTAQAALDVYETSLARAVRRLETATANMEAAKLDEKVVAAQAERDSQKIALTDAGSTTLEAHTSLSEVELELARASARLEQDAEVVAKRNDAVTQAEVASVAQGVLEDVARQLQTQIRPALEGLVSEILAGMSNSRFDSVRIDDTWTIRVRDDGTYRELDALSGGEADLVALAMRLGLQAVVAERHNSGGAGFIVLDEPLGSLDEARRNSVLESLRGLRGRPQIWLISHVGGIEDAADKVYEVGRADDDEELLSVVAAL